MEEEGCKTEGYTYDSTARSAKVLNRKGSLVHNFIYLFGRKVGSVKRKLQLGPYSLLFYSDKNMSK